MNAIEFQTTIKEDGSILIPHEYAGNTGANVRVILLSTETLNVSQVKKTKFSAVSINTKDYKFDRVSANER